MFSNILFYKIFNEDRNKLLKEIEKREKVNIISGNPEILDAGLKNSMLKKCFTDKTALIIPDGIGTIVCSKIVKQPVKEKLAGVEIMQDVIQKCALENKSIYLLGARNEVLKDCIFKLKNKYKNLNIVGYHDGYFPLDDCDDLINDIKNKKPYAIFVAMGCPRQEIFIWNNMNRLPCKIFMGVGGSFDVISGNVKRAPKIMIDLGLEWLYRTIKEPFRIKRLGVIPKFIFKVIFTKKYYIKK